MYDDVVKFPDLMIHALDRRMYGRCDGCVDPADRGRGSEEFRKDRFIRRTVTDIPKSNTKSLNGDPSEGSEVDRKTRREM